MGSLLRTISRHHRLHRHHYDNWFINGRTAIGEPAESVAPPSLFLSSLLFSLFIIVRTLFPLFRLLRLNSPFHGWRCTAARTAKTAKDMTRSGKVIDCRQHDSVPVFLLLRPDFFVSIFYILIQIVHLSISLRAVKFVDRDTFRREGKFRVQPLTKPTTVLLSLLFTSSLLITVLRADDRGTFWSDYWSARRICTTYPIEALFQRQQRSSRGGVRRKTEQAKIYWRKKREYKKERRGGEGDDGCRKEKEKKNSRMRLKNFPSWFLEHLWFSIQSIYLRSGLRLHEEKPQAHPSELVLVPYRQQGERERERKVLEISSHSRSNEEKTKLVDMRGRKHQAHSTSSKRLDKPLKLTRTLALLV